MPRNITRLNRDIRVIGHTKAAGFEIRPFDLLDFKRIYPTKTLKGHVYIYGTKPQDEPKLGSVIVP
jgi:hypothetical protein